MENHRYMIYEYDITSIYDEQLNVVNLNTERRETIDTKRISTNKIWYVLERFPQLSTPLPLLSWLVGCFED